MARSESFSFSPLFLFSKEKVRCEANPFLFAYFFFLAKKKYGAKRNPFLFAYFFFLVKKKWVLVKKKQVIEQQHGQRLSCER